MLKKFFVILFLLLNLALSSFGQENKPLFTNGDRVCFIGNSITHGGEFHPDIFLYYATRFPTEKVSFFNCGISGDVAGEIIVRLDSDIMVHNPGYGVLMVGMNDMVRGFSGVEKRDKQEISKREADAIELYRKNIEYIADYLSQHQCKLILQTPSIYDQTAKIPTQNMVGVNDLLGKCGDFLKDFAQKNNITVVDYWTIMKNINEREQKKDESFTIVGEDRVHPGSQGHLVMAYQFLKSTGAPEYVSKIVIDAKSKKIVELLNCSAKINSFKNGNLQFECLENALPYPVKAEAVPALGLVPFTEDLNQEILKVSNLEPGVYNLFIDKTDVGSYSSSDLKKGINLSLNPLTPQYKQALDVMRSCDEYQEVYSHLRTIAVVEYRSLQDYHGPDDLDAKKAFLNQKLEKIQAEAYYGYVKNKCDQYYDDKPKQQQFMDQLNLVRDKVYILNIPKSHSYELVLNK